MANESKYYNKHVTVFDLSRDNKKIFKKAMTKLLFCHTSESTVYCLILRVVETVEKTRKPKCCAGQNITKKT